MNRVLFGVLGGLLLVAAAIFWWQGRAYTEVGSAPPKLLGTSSTAANDTLPSSNPNGRRGDAPPEASEVTREQKRFDRLDRDRDGRVTRNEVLSPRAAAFRKLDVNHDNLLTFEEWSVRTTDRFAGADANRDGWLSRAEFATTKPKRSAKPTCRCAAVPRSRNKAPPRQDTSNDDGDLGDAST